jgi:two-component system, NtrC family, sensor kinase
VTDCQLFQPDTPSSCDWPAHFFAQTADLALVLDGAGRFVALNAAAEKLFGRPAAELLGQPFTTVLDPFSHEKAALMLARTLAEGRVTDWELDHLQGGGPPVLIGYTTTALRNSAGEAVGVGALGRDLTAHLDLTARLAHANQQLEGALLQLEKTHAQLKDAQTQLVQSEKMRSLGQLVAGVAHEINNPAAFVTNNLAHLARLVPALHALFDAYSALRSQATPQQATAIAAAETAAEMKYLWQDLPDLVKESQDGMERIRNIVLALRNFSRLDEAELKEADLNEGLASTLQLIRPLCKNRIEIIEDYSELPPVLCRPGELNQVFLNLLTNAVQAIEGSGRIWVRTRRQGKQIQVTIRDTGVGMEAATLAKLGEPFFTTKPVGAGVGLGLAIGFGIVQRHHGRLRFESQPGQGASAIVELPLSHD